MATPSFTRRALAAAAIGAFATLDVSAASATQAPAPEAQAEQQQPAAGNAEALRAKHAASRERLEKNGFGRPLMLESSDRNGDLKGDVYAVLPHPYARVASGLTSPQSWCDVLMLPFNTKHCEAGANGAAHLTLYVGRRTDTPLEEAFKLNYNYNVAARGDDYLRLVLGAKEGPVGTHDYRIVFEATPLDAGHTFIHLHYAYAYGAMTRLAMQAYLSTAGAS
jgi:hypothetical protein